MIRKVSVRWFDSYYEEFECEEVRSGNFYLWLRLVNGHDRYIPLHQVRWFSLNPESHQHISGEEQETTFEQEKQILYESVVRCDCSPGRFKVGCFCAEMYCRKQEK